MEEIPPEIDFCPSDDSSAERPIYLKGGNRGAFGGLINPSAFDIDDDRLSLAEIGNILSSAQMRRYDRSLFNAYRQGSDILESGRRFDPMIERQHRICLLDQRGNELTNFPSDGSQLTWLRRGVGADYSSWCYMKSLSHYAMYVQYGGTG